MTQLSTRAVELARFLKSQVSSTTATLTDWLAVTLLIHAGVYYVHAVVMGAVVGAMTDFSIKKWWIFKTETRRSSVEMIRYALVSGSSALLNGGIVYVCVDGLHMTKPVGVVVTSLFVGFAWNYPMHRLFVFSTTANPTRPEHP